MYVVVLHLQFQQTTLTRILTPKDQKQGILFVQGKASGQTPREQQAGSDSSWAAGKSQASKTKTGRT